MTRELERLISFFRTPVLLLSADGRVQAANALAAQQLEASSQKELRERAFTDFVSSDHETTRAYLENCLRSGDPIPGALVLRTTAGAAVDVRCDGGRAPAQSDDSDPYILLRLTPKPTADRNFIALNQKIDELNREILGREQAEEALRRNEEKFRSLLEAAPDGIVIVDATGTINLVNKQAEILFEYSRDEMIGQPIELLLPDDMKKGHVDKRSDYAKDPRLRAMGGGLDLYGRRNGGELFPTEISLSPITTSEGPLVLSVIRDVSERKKSEQERRIFEEKMQHAQKLESLGVLAGGIAHDFNNLLLGVLGNADMGLMDIPTGSPARDHLHDIIKSAQRAADLCKQLLAYSGKGRFVVQPVDLSEVVEDMGNLLEVSVSKKAAIRYDFGDDVPAIEVDLTQLRQIIMNMITNASDALEEKDGTITVATGVMECDRGYLSETWLDDNLQEGRYVFLEVTDSGCGMDSDLIARIFDPFFSSKTAGRGLGLAAVLGIVRGHMGALKVYTEEGKGTTFKVLFPITTDEAISIHLKEPQVADFTASGTVLVIDDDETVRDLARGILERYKFSVLTAEDGVVGLDLYKKHRGEITAVLLDMTMPRMGGEETFREMRKVDKDVRVLLTSGYNEQEATMRFTGKGLAGFIQKPYRAQDLVRALAAILTPKTDK